MSNRRLHSAARCLAVLAWLVQVWLPASAGWPAPASGALAGWCLAGAAPGQSQGQSQGLPQDLAPNRLASGGIATGLSGAAPADPAGDEGSAADHHLRCLLACAALDGSAEPPALPAGLLLAAVATSPVAAPASPLQPTRAGDPHAARGPPQALSPG